MTTKFFTNKDGNTLLEKFKGAFKDNPHIREFDALVGYFRSAGYFKIRPFLKNIPKIRILVGINVDDLSARYKKQGLRFLAAKSDETIKYYQKELKQEIEEADYSEEIEKSIRQFIQDITDGKLKIKAHPSRKLHAKIYIFRPDKFNPHNMMGEVITGSSNLSEAGLGVAHSASNYEFNVSLRDYEDIKFATDEFEVLWQEGIEILPEAVHEIKSKTFLKGEFTPFELYIKMLIEYFGSEIEFNPDNIKDLPGNFKQLTYQLDAMNQGSEILKKHNGLFLADVVGLGKTIVAILIARRYFLFNRSPERIPWMLIIIPPALKSQWKETVEQFKMHDQVHVDIRTNGSLHKIEHPEYYDLIIVDEAHKFRNDSTRGYENLQKICKTPCQSGKKNKKVILISATPLNNRPNDIYNQVLLFQDINSSTLDIPLGDFFSRINKRYKEIISKNARYSAYETAELYTDVRNKVIEPLTVRRTRTDLMDHELYRKDLEKQGFTLPKLSEPQKLLYPLEGPLNELYNKTIKLITKNMQYIRYRVIEFIKTQEHARDYNRPEFISEQLVGIMKTLLIKRLDSSFYAFHCTLKRFVRASEAMRKMVDNDRIYIVPDHKVEDYIMEDKENELLEKLAETQDTDPGIKILKESDLKDGFTKKLKKDHDILTSLEKEWREVVQSGTDPKLKKFFSVLDNKLLLKSYNPEQKLVIFSESQETTKYLEDKLIGAGRRDVLAVSSKNRGNIQEKIRYNFDADVPIGQQCSKCNIIVTTEVLAEGVNLHRSNVILNYDTPWNATRLMQRIGRINRISTKANEIYVYNFFPTENVEDDIQLKKRAIIKLQAFHSALGEDSQIYSTDEQVESFGLFDKNPQADNESNERLKYLMEIRKFKEESPDEFRRINNLPPKIRNAVKNQERRGSTLSYLQNKQHHAFYSVNQNEQLKELSFLEAASVITCDDPNTKPLPLHKEHHKQVKQALEHFSKAGDSKIVLEKHTPKLSRPQNYAINYVKEIQDNQQIREEEKRKLESAIETIKKGRFQALPRDINKLKNSTKNQNLTIADLLKRLLKIIDGYPLVSEPELDPEESLKKPVEDIPKIIIAQSYI